MGTKHTPGPWEAQYTIVIGPDSEVVADTSCKGARQSPRDTQKANARLIATAPEMLTQLRRMASKLALVTAGRGLPNTGADDPDVRETRALLAKIERENNA